MQLVLCLSAAVLATSLSGETLHSIAQVTSLRESEFSGHRFELTGQVVAYLRVGSFVLQDGSGGFDIRHNTPLNPELGSVIAVVGNTRMESNSNIPFLDADTITVLRKEPLPHPRAVSLKQLQNGECDFQLVTASGVVFDAFQDEIDPEWNYLIVRQGDDSIYVAVFDPQATMRKHLEHYVDTEIHMSGVGLPSRAGLRAFTGPYLLLQSESDIKILDSPPDDPFSLPPLEDLLHARPERISAMRRRTAIGHVLASWGKGSFLISDDSRRIIRIDCADPADTPSYGHRVKVVGFPTTDLYRINLVHAHVKHIPDDRPPPALTAETTTASNILLDGSGKLKIKAQYQGRLIRMRGSVRAMPSEIADDKRLFVESDGLLIPIDVSAIYPLLTDICTGCRIEVTGICVFDTPNWQVDRTFPKIDNVMLIPRCNCDIRVLSRPSWWTVGRLFAAIGSLLAALLFITLWNFSLRKLAERRGRELFRSEIGKARAELRVNERTRLAVELHDSIAQNLMGAFLQVEAADLSRNTDPSALDRCLKLAMQTLQSCRDELRYCLWDLRSNILDESDAVDVLHRTLAPHIGAAKLSINANLPRPRISDNTFHSLLRIARELVTNAVRHGKAKHIAVAAHFSKATLILSVTDDGCGFDPSRRPGPDEGHFGLQGIEDRIRKMSGRLVIDSSPGQGSSITVTFTPEKQELS